MLTGISINDYLPSLQRSIHLGLNIIDLVTTKVGLSLFWQQMQPQVLAALTRMFSYRYITLYLAFLVVLCLVVLIIYAFVCSMMRILGCDVCPFPGAGVNRLIRRWRHSVLRAIARRRQAQRAQTGRTRRLHKRGAMAQCRVRNTSSLSRMALPLIDIQHVSYSYPLPAHHPNDVATVPALQDISLSIEQGEYVALLGHNGSGKSTLARLCNALLLPDQGDVRVQGMDTRDQVKQRQIRECVGIIFQNPDNQLIATLVEDDVAWSLTLAGYAAPTIRARVDQALAAVGIEHLRYLAPHNLSGGRRQRVAIAALLALRPPLARGVCTLGGMRYVGVYMPRLIWLACGMMSMAGVRHLL